MEVDKAALQSLSLTHVSYDPTSRISHASAYLALVPQALMITYVAFIYATREIEILLMFAGQLACEALNWVLKRYIQEERPTKMLGKGYGMPSSHAQFVGYFSTYLVLFLLLRHDPYKTNTSTTHQPTPLWQRLILAGAAVAGALAVAQSRVLLSYHHPRQVYVGFGVGIACAVAYFIALTIARRFGIVDQLLDSSIARWVRLRDLLESEDMVDAGWERWQLRRAQRSKQSLKKAPGIEASKKKTRRHAD